MPRLVTQVPGPTPVLPPQQPVYVQNYHPPQGRYPSQQRNPIVPVKQVEYDPEPLKEGEVTDDYVEGVHGELVPMYYTSAQHQYRPPGRITIKCFGCGGPHKKVDCPNRMTPGAFMPLCGDCGPGHPVAECPLRIPSRIPQLPTAPVNMIGTVTTPSKEDLVPALAVTRAQAQAEVRAPEATPTPTEEREPQPRNSTPLDYPDAELELGRIKALQEWVDEERIRFETKRARRKPYSLTEGGSLAEPALSIRQEVDGNESNRPIPLREVLNVNVQIPLSTLLECIPNLRDDFAAWVNEERKAPLEEVECDYIEEGADK